jgi:hypothetical protein
VKKQYFYFALFFLIPVVVVLIWWGLFSSATLKVETAPAYDYVYLDAEGPYSKLASKQDEVLFYMNKQNLAHRGSFTLVMTDPRKTPYKDLLARTGYVVEHPVEVKAPLNLGHQDAQRVVAVEIKAHPLLAYGKTYSKLLSYCKEHDMQLKLPTVEILEHSVLRVEMPLDKG